MKVAPEIELAIHKDLLAGSRNKVASLSAEVAYLVSLIDDLLEGHEPCVYDCQGHCLMHGWLQFQPPCPHWRARDVLLLAKAQGVIQS